MYIASCFTAVAVMYNFPVQRFGSLLFSFTNTQHLGTEVGSKMTMFT